MNNEEYISITDMLNSRDGDIISNKNKLQYKNYIHKTKKENNIMEIQKTN